MDKQAMCRDIGNSTQTHGNPEESAIAAICEDAEPARRKCGIDRLLQLSMSGRGIGSLTAIWPNSLLHKGLLTDSAALV